MFALHLTSLLGSYVSKNQSIENAIAGMKAGSRESLSDFYELCKGSIYGFALSLLKNKEDAEDILQDVLLKIYHSAANYKENGNPMPWILTITKNLSLDKLREKKRLSYKDDDEWENIAFTNDTLDEEDKYYLTQMLSGLNDEERQIVILHASAGLKHREIARLLNMKLSTCLSKYTRAIKKLQNNNEGI